MITVTSLLAVAATGDGEEPGPWGWLGRDPARRLRPQGREIEWGEVDLTGQLSNHRLTALFQSLTS